MWSCSNEQSGIQAMSKVHYHDRVILTCTIHKHVSFMVDIWGWSLHDLRYDFALIKLDIKDPTCLSG